MSNIKKVIRIAEEIKKDAGKEKGYNRSEFSTLQEKIIVASYRKMENKKLIDLRYYINQILKERKLAELRNKKDES